MKKGRRLQMFSPGFNSGDGRWSEINLVRIIETTNQGDGK